MQAIQSAITFMQNLGAACMMPNVPHHQKSYKGETLLMGKLLLISDLDKTLLDNNAKVPQPCLDSIAAFTAQGGLFSVCTGRPTRGALMYSELVSLINTPIISYNGACIYDTKASHALWQVFLPGETEDVFCTALELFPRIGLAIYRGEDDLTCTIHPNEYTDELLWKRESYRAETCTLRDFPKPWNKCVLTGPEEDMAKCAKFIRENTPCPITSVLSEKIFLEVNGPDVSKGKALVRLSEYLQLPIENIIAIGDSMNDKPMLQAAGVSVAVANAIPEVQTMVNVVVAANYEFGICECIERVALPLLRGESISK